MRGSLCLLACAPALFAWSPTFHEVQTKLASRMVPAPMARLLQEEWPTLLQAGRGPVGGAPPTLEQVEDQFDRILALSEKGIGRRKLVMELGTLAHLVQLLTDPGAVPGVDSLRQSFTDYGDENLGRMVLTREPAWAVASPLDPKRRILEWTREKFDRHRQLLEHFDQERNARLGEWDERSLPFAELQLSFCTGIHATANLWILLWRAAGDRWLEASGPGAR